jgi:hypothetical protein
MGKVSAASLPIRIKNLMRGTRNPFEVVSSARGQLSARQMPALAKALAFKHYQGRPAFPYLFPREIEDLRRDDRSLAPVRLAVEIHWTASLLSNYVGRINSYLSIKHLIEAKLWQEDYAAALKELGKLIQQCGVSLWTIEIQQALLQLAEGLPAQKAFTRDIRTRRETENSVAYIAFHSSIRNENTTQIFSFIDHFTDRIRTNLNDGSFRGWLLYRICDRWEPNEESTSALLRCENASSLIDIFETFMRVAIRTIENRQVGDIAFSEAVGLLEEIQDPRIRHIRNISGDKTRIFDDAQYPLTADAYYRSNFNHAIELGRSAITAGEPDGSVLEFVARSYLRRTNTGKESSEKPAIIADLMRLLGEEFEIDAFFSLAKLAINLRFTSIPATFEELVWDQVSTDPLKKPHLTLHSYLASSRISKDLSLSLNLPSTSTLKTIIEESRSASILIAWRTIEPITSPELIDLDSDAARDSLALSEYLCFAKAEWAKILDIPDSLLQACDVVVRRRAQRLYARALLESGSLHEAVMFIVTGVLKDSGLQFQLPVQEVCRKLDKAYRKQHAGDLSTSIVLDIGCRTDSSHETIRAYAYEDLLHFHKLERPSQLAACVTSFTLEHIIYYLRNLCTLEILERSLAFSGTSQVEDERIAVCALLAKLDSSNAAQYEEEIKGLTQRQVIRRGVMRIEESKIFVDSLGLSRWAEKNLGESFKRYKALRAAGMDVGENDLAEALQALSDDEKQLKPLELPVNEAIDLMISMLQKFTHEYFTNPEHGLDYYLSMRIRHGAFSGQLRSPLEAQQIVTQRSSGSGEYKHNTQWRNILFTLEADAWEKIDEALAAFTRSFDATIQNYAATYLQIYSDEKPLGLFRLTITNVFVALISSHMQSDSDIAEFASTCFDYLDGALDGVLEKVRTHIDLVLATEIERHFTDLETNLNTIGTANIHELDSAVRVAQTALAQSLVQLKEWFHRSEATEVPDWTFEQLVRIGLASVTKMHESFLPLLEMELTSLPRLVNLSLFADILFIVFDNIRVHSGLSYPTIRVSAQLDGGKLRVKIVNDVAPTVLTEEKKARVGDIRRKVDEGRFNSGARREGGSGLMKLRNRIRVAEEDSSEFSFGLHDDNTFSLEFALPFHFVRRKEQM